jgi:hypothetical protein
LEISQGSQDWCGIWETACNHDGTRLDLRGFAALKYLTAPALFFVSPVQLEVPREGLYKLLPRSLEKIQVSAIIILELTTENCTDKNDLA